MGESRVEVDNSGLIVTLIIVPRTYRPIVILPLSCFTFCHPRSRKSQQTGEWSFGAGQCSYCCLMGLRCADRTYVRCRNLMRQLCYHCRNDMHRPTLGPETGNPRPQKQVRDCESATYCMQAYSAYSICFYKLHASNPRQC